MPCPCATPFRAVSWTLRWLALLGFLTLTIGCGEQRDDVCPTVPCIGHVYADGWQPRCDIVAANLDVAIREIEAQGVNSAEDTCRILRRVDLVIRESPNCWEYSNKPGTLVCGEYVETWDRRPPFFERETFREIHTSRDMRSLAHEVLHAIDSARGLQDHESHLNWKADCEIKNGQPVGECRYWRADLYYRRGAAGVP